MYLEHFGLKTNPFGISHRLDFLYKSGAFEESMAHLVYGLDNSEAIVMITGAIGTGKTMAVQSFFAHLGDRYVTALVTNTRVDSKELLKLVLEDLGAPAPVESDKSDLLIAFKKFLVSLGREGKRIVIVIDEAQNLSRDVLEEIRLLTNIGQGDEQPVQIILVGQPELAQAVEKPDLAQLRQRIRVHYQLAPLSRRELEEYIDHRMKVAGGQAGVFAGPALDRIFAASGGVPRVVNTLCGDALLAAYVDGRKRVEARDLDESAPGTPAVPAAAPSAAVVPPRAAPVAPARPARVEGPAPDTMAARRQAPEQTKARGEQDDDKKASPYVGPRWAVPVAIVVILAAVAFVFVTHRGDRQPGSGSSAERTMAGPVEGRSAPVVTPDLDSPADSAASAGVGAPGSPASPSASTGDSTARAAGTAAGAHAEPESARPAAEEPLAGTSVATPSAPVPVASVQAPAKAPAKVPTKVADAPATNDFYIHVCSFKAVEHADTVARQFTGQGLPAIVREQAVQDVQWFRVYLGPYATHAEAVKKAEELKAGGAIQYSQIARLGPVAGS